MDRSRLLTLPICRDEEISDLTPVGCGKGMLASMAYAVDDLKTLKDLWNNNPGTTAYGGDLMAKTAADQVAEMMIDAGIKRVYGVVGDSINPIIDAIRRSDGKLRWVHCRNEEVGAFAAGADFLNRADRGLRRIVWSR